MDSEEDEDLKLAIALSLVNDSGPQDSKGPSVSKHGFVIDLTSDENQNEDDDLVCMKYYFNGGLICYHRMHRCQLGNLHV